MSDRAESPTLRESETDVWMMSWHDGWVSELAAALSAVVEHVRGAHDLELTDASGATFGHADLVAVVAESTDTLMESVRADRLTTAQLVEMGASAANLAIIATMAGTADAADAADAAALLDLDDLDDERLEPASLSADGDGEHRGLVAARHLFHRLADKVWSALDPGIRRLPDGRYELAWRAADRLMVGVLASELDELLDSDDPSIVRLFPPAYGTDAERSAGFDAIARYEMIDRRRESLQVLRSAIQSGPLDAEGLEAVMRSINDLRLVLGTRLDVTEDAEPVARPGDPDAPRIAAYHRLSQLLGQIVGALAEG